MVNYFLNVQSALIFDFLKCSKGPSLKEFKDINTFTGWHFCLCHHERFQKVREKLDCGRPNLIIIDDFTTIQQLSIGAVETFRQFQILQAIRRDLPNDNTSLLLVGCGKEFDALDTFNLMFRLKPIGTGFNAKITGEVGNFWGKFCLLSSL